MDQGQTAIAASALALVSGCYGGTVVVDYAIQADVITRDANGVARAPGTVVTVPRPQGLLSPFDAVQYKGPDFDWTFGTGTLGMGGSVGNHSSQTVCLRFDKAQIRSNLHPQPLPLKTYSWSTFEGKWSILGSTDPKRRQDFTPPSLCVEPGKDTRFSYGPDLGPLFPTEKMFNVRWKDNTPDLLDKGVGNWVALTMPVEIGDRREVMEVRLTAVDSKARISTY